jgi:hypothetical protein
VDFGILLLILFILAPLLEKLLKAGRPPQAPPEEQQGPPGQRLPREQRRPMPRAETEEESAAGVLPDDLWEILTGERQAPPAEPPPQQRAERPPVERQPRPPVETRPRPPVEVRPRPAPRAERPPAPLRGRHEGRQPVRERERDPVALRRSQEAERERRLPPVGLRKTAGDAPLRRERSGGPPPSAADDLVRRQHVHEAPAVVSLEAPIEDSDARYARFQKRLAGMSAPATINRTPDQHSTFFASDEDLRRGIIMAEILGKPKGLQ